MHKIDTSSFLNYLILLYALVIPVSLDLLRILVPLIVIVWLIEGDIRNKFTLIREEPVFKAIGLLILILLLSLLWTEPQNLKFGFKYITRYWYILPIFAIFTSLKKAYIPYLLSFFLAGMSISVAISYLTYFHIIPFKEFYAEGASPLMHHTLYSIFLAFSIGLLLKLALSSRTTIRKILYTVLFLLFTVNLFLNIGRAGHLLFFIILPFVLIGHYKVTIRSVTLTLLFILGISYLIFTQSDIFRNKMEQTHQNLTHISYNTSLGARIGLNIVARDIVMEHPLLGVGAGDYLSEKKKIIDERYPQRQYVRFLVHYHNQYAAFTVIAGIFGLLAYLFIWFQIGRIQIKDPTLRMVKYLFILTFITTSLIDAMFHLNRPLSLFALFLGLLMAQSKYEKLDTQKKN
jgi:O-antigen ligase